ncbi:MAG: hypothetical protein R3C19_15595 [Planctomycetaceae bacterium]
MSASPLSRTPGTQRLLCLLLCVCAWRGPVPIVHHHESLRNSAVRYARHIAAFHECPEDGCDNKWHWHLAMPDQPPNDDDEASWPEVPVDLTAAFAVVTAQSSGNMAAPDLDMDDQISAALYRLNAAEPRQRRPCSGDAGSFLQSFAGSAPMCALTGVALR